jgi:hypothetical protein
MPGWITFLLSQLYNKCWFLFSKCKPCGGSRTCGVGQGRRQLPMRATVCHNIKYLLCTRNREDQAVCECLRTIDSCSSYITMNAIIKGVQPRCVKCFIFMANDILIVQTCSSTHIICSKLFYHYVYNCKGVNIR